MSLTSGSTSKFSNRIKNHKRSSSTANATYASVISSKFSSISSYPSLSSSKITQISNNQKDSFHSPLLELRKRNEDYNEQTSPESSILRALVENQIAPLVFPVSLLVNSSTDPKVSSKSNDKFHKLFPSLYDEYVIESK
jgi:hypothetical protein